MTTYVECDRCHKKVVGGGGSQVTLNVADNSVERDYDLCRGCTMELRTLLDNPPPKGKER